MFIILQTILLTFQKSPLRKRVVVECALLAVTFFVSKGSSVLNFNDGQILKIYNARIDNLERDIRGNVPPL